ncbi:hypothetical protein OSTOST_07928 [Ostertagia ostertagi]
MRLAVTVAVVLLVLSHCSNSVSAETEDNEFAEFEDEEMEEVEQVQPSSHSTDKKVVKEEVQKQKADDFDDDYGVVEDEDEMKEKEDEQQPVQPLKFADFHIHLGTPIMIFKTVAHIKGYQYSSRHFRSNWASYQTLIAMYLLNYVIGRNTNQSMALEWFDNVRSLLEQQFALIRTMKRQDLMSRIMAFFTPQKDVITFKLELDPGELDSFVMIFGQKKSVVKQYKEMLDLATYTVEKKNTSQFGLPASFALYAEQSEATYAIFEPGVVAILRKYEKAIEHVHISDQYSGQKPPEGETYTRLPEVVRLVQFCLNLDECRDKEAQAELLHLMFYVVDKVRKFRMSKEAKQKADKRRREVEEAFIKTTHQLRQEAAQARREEKTRERKQRLLEEEDPEKQRRLEKLEMKREAKAKQPKMKQLKVKM